MWCLQSNIMSHRWSDKMASDQLTKEHWRKSSQWFAVTREHAQVIVDDVVVYDAFRAHCYPNDADGYWR